MIEHRWSQVEKVEKAKQHKDEKGGEKGEEGGKSRVIYRGIRLGGGVGVEGVIK